MGQTAGTWNNPAGGSWGDAANWVNGTIAFGASQIANFNFLDLTADAVITLNTNQTIGDVRFNDQPFATHGYVINGAGGSLVLSRTTATETAPLEVAGLNTATINATIDTTGIAGYRKRGTGTLIMNGIHLSTGTVSQDQGTLVISNAQALGTGGVGVGTFFAENSNNNFVSLRFGSGITSINQNIYNTAGTALDIYASNDATFSGAVVSNGGSRRLRNFLDAGRVLTFAGAITTSGQKWELNGSGDSILTGAVSSGGNLLFASGGLTTLRTAVPSGTAVNVHNGTLAVDTANGGNISSQISMGGGGDGSANYYPVVAKPTLVALGAPAGGALNVGNNINVNRSDSKIILNPNGGSITLNASAFNFFRGSGSGVVDVQIPVSNGTLLVGGGNHQNGMLPFVTVNNGADFAASSGGVLGTFAGYTDVAGAGGFIASSAATTYRINSSSTGNVNLAAGTVAANAILHNDATARTLAIGPASTLTLGTVGSVLAAPGSGTLTIGATPGTGRITASTTANSEVLLINNSSNPMIVNSFITNNGATAVRLSKSGDGLAILTASNTFTGPTFVNGGTLQLGAAGALGIGAGTQELFVNTGALDLNGYSQQIRDLRGAGIITNTSASAATLTIRSTSGTNQTNNFITGNITLVKQGNFQIEIGNDNNNFTGGLVMNEGSIRFNNGTRLGNATITFNATSANNNTIWTPSQVMPVTTTTNPYVVMGPTEGNPFGGGTRRWEGGWTHNGPIMGNGSLQFQFGSNPNTVTLGGDNSTFTGTLLFNAGSANAGTENLNFSASNSGSGSAFWDMRADNDTSGTIRWAGEGDGTLQFGAVAASTTGAGTITMRNIRPGTTAIFEIGARNQDSTFSGTIVTDQGLAGISKVGTHTLTLTNNNTYTGPTYVNAGTLVTNGTLAATPITVNGGTMRVNAATGNAPAVVNGGELNVNATTLGANSLTINAGAVRISGSGTIGTIGATADTGVNLISGNLSLVDSSINTLSIATGDGATAHAGLTLGGGSLSFELGAGNTADKIQLTDAAAAVSSGATTPVNVTPAAGWNGSGVYTLITAPGGGVASTNFAMGTVPAGIFTYDLSNPDANNLVLTVTGNAIPADAYWLGDRGDGVWANYSPLLPAAGPYNTNWSDALSGGVDPQQLPGGISTVHFAATGAGSLNTTLGADFSIQGLVYEATTTGSVGIGGANTLTVGASGITIASGSGAHTISAAGVALSASQTWANNSSNDFTVSSDVSGPFGLTVNGTGSGAIVLSGDNSFTGGTTIAAGKIRLDSNTALGSGILTMNGGTLDLNNRNLAVSALGGGGGVIQNDAVGNATLTFNTVSGGGASSSTSIANGAGTVGVVKNGAGTLVLTGTNSYTGGTNIGGGTLGFNADAALGAASSQVTFSGPATLQPSVATPVSINRQINVPTGITGSLNTSQLGTGNANAVTLDGAVVGNGTLAKTGEGTLILNNPGNTILTTQLNAGVTQLGVNNALSNGTTILNTGATLDLNGKTVSAGTLHIATSGGTITNSSVTQAVLTNTTVLSQVDATSFTVAGSNPIRIDSLWTQNAGQIATRYLNKIGSGTLTIGGGPDAPSNLNEQAHLQVGGRPTVVNSVYSDFVPGGYVILDKSSPVGLNGSNVRILQLDSGTVVFGSSTIAQSGGGAGQIGEINIGGQGVLDLNGASGLNATTGILRQSQFANFPNAGDTTFAFLTDWGNGTITNNSINPATLTIGANNLSAGAGTLGATTVNIRDGVGTLSLVKIGTGTIALATANGGSTDFGGDVRFITGNTGNTFSGGMYVNGGTVFAWANDALGAGPISVAGGATLDSTVAGGLTLSGSNRWFRNSGNVVGTLTTNAAVSGAGTFQNDVTVQTGGSVAGGAGDGNYSIGTLHFLGNLNLNPHIKSDLNASTADVVAVTSNLDLGGAGTVDVNFTVPPTLATPYTIATFGSKSGVAFNNTNFTANSRANVTFSETANALQVTVDSWTAANLTWTGTGTSSWDVGNNQNWNNDIPAADKFFQLDNITFDDTGAGPSVNLTTAVAPGATTVNTSTNAYVLSGVGTLTGTGGLLKQGTSALTIDAAANYTGTTTIQGGRVIMKGSNCWAPALSLAGGADIQSGRLVLDYSETGQTSPAAAVQTALDNAFNSGFATGQLRSTTAASGQGLGWKDGTGTSQVSVVATYLGDIDLDGDVDSIDFNAFTPNYGELAGQIWVDGDFNYDGKVNTEDFNYIAGNFGAAALPTGGSLPAAALGAVVPEPATAGFLGIGLIGLLSRRRRR